MTYSSQTDVFSEEGDFTENFLTTSKIGHSVHFATAAALMFRYYGIPARYVEGYLITPQDIEGKQARGHHQDPRHQRTCLDGDLCGRAWLDPS